MPTIIERFEGDVRAHVVALHERICSTTDEFLAEYPDAVDVRKELLKAVMAELAQPCGTGVCGLRYVPEWMRRLELPQGSKF